MKTDMSRDAVTHRLRQMEGLWLLSKALADAKVAHKRGSRKNRGLEIQASIRNILLREWNPSASSRGADVDRSYDQHIAPILRILVGSRSIDDLVEWLRRTVMEHDGGSPTHDVERLRAVASQLLDLNVMLK